MIADLLTRNTRLNKDRAIPFVAASWSEATISLGEFDLIVGSDLLYEPSHTGTLPEFLNRHCAPH